MAINSLKKKKLKKWGLLGLALCVLMAAVCYHIFRPDPEEEMVKKLTSAILSRPRGRQRFIDKHLPSNQEASKKKASKSKTSSPSRRRPSYGSFGSREEMRQAMQKLSPETRRRVARVVMKERLKQARESTKNLSEKKKRDIVNDMVEDVRHHFRDMTPEQREKARERFNSEEGKQRMKDHFEFYFDEFSAKEREMLDPLVREVLINVDAL